VELTARGLPWFELALGALLLVGFWRRAAATSASLLLALFLGLMIRALAKGMDIDCGCFGPGERISWLTLTRDGVLMAVSLCLTVMSFPAKAQAGHAAAGNSVWSMPPPGLGGSRDRRPH
jgi:hypothetical protein